MKIYRRCVWDIETGRVLEEDSYDYSGPVAEAKGAGGNMPNLGNLHPAVMDALQQYHPDLHAMITGMNANPGMAPVRGGLGPNDPSGLRPVGGGINNISPVGMPSMRPNLGGSMFGPNLLSLRAPLGNMPQRPMPSALSMAINKRFGG